MEIDDLAQIVQEMIVKFVPNINEERFELLGRLKELRRDKHSLPLNPASQAILCKICGAPESVHYNNWSELYSTKTTDDK